MNFCILIIFWLFVWASIFVYTPKDRTNVKGVLNNTEEHCAQENTGLTTETATRGRRKLHNANFIIVIHLIITGAMRLKKGLKQHKPYINEKRK